MTDRRAPEVPVEPVVPVEASRLAAAGFAFLVGLWLSLLQFSYFFMLEVYLSSRATSFFVSMFFWLIGLLIGLNITTPRAFSRFVVVAPIAYYCAFALLRAMPYQIRLLPIVGACIATGGVLAGSFFPHARHRFPKVKQLFFHENNGFVVGILLSLVGAVFAGRYLLLLSPIVGALPVTALLRWERRP